MDEAARKLGDSPAYPACGEVYGNSADLRWTPGMTTRTAIAAQMIVSVVELEAAIRRWPTPGCGKNVYSIEERARCEATVKVIKADALLTALAAPPAVGGGEER